MTHQKDQTILLVEDNHTDARCVKRAFAKAQIQNEIHHFESGDEVLKFLEMAYEKPGTRKPGIILLDLNMPGLDGFQVLHILKSSPSYKSIPVVVLTTSDDKSDVERSYNAGANSYINKPRDFDGYVSTAKTLRDYWFSLSLLPDDNC